MRTCPECRRENEPHYRFCLGCGHDLGAVPGSEWKPPARKRVERCRHCGTKVDAEATLCPQCNAPL
jgi:hypothetical protein